MDTGIRTLAEQDINTLVTIKQTQYGAVGVTADGRRFRYVGFGGTSTIAPGAVVVASTTVTNYTGIAITAVATGGQIAANLLTGSTQIVLTNGATAITADQFTEGYLDIQVGVNGSLGAYRYKIKGNTAANAGAQFTVYVTEAFRNTTAYVAGTDTANLAISTFAAVNVSAVASVPVGVTVMPVPNTATVTNYGWVQTNGAVNVLNDAGGTITVGGAFAQSVTTAGSVVAATASTAPTIGVTRRAISASTAGQAFLLLS